jgi:hypothetical protein
MSLIRHLPFKFKQLLRIKNMQPDLIVTLTTIPSRFEQLKYVIESIVNQTIFDKIKYFYNILPRKGNHLQWLPASRK